MSNGRTKYQSRENQQRIRRVLNEHRDPIGVVENPALTDEYDDYIGTVYVMLMDHRASEETIRGYLQETATGSIGLASSEEFADRCAKTAAVLVGLRPQFDTH
jgi:hypothetical protein